MVPSGKTAVKEMMFSFIVPYRTAFVPEQLVPTIPPMEAPGPGSYHFQLENFTSGKKRPSSLMAALRSLYVRPG